MNTCSIRTEQLSRDFGRVRAVDSLSMEVPTGSVFGFLGPNGAGKTTTIRLLLGLLDPSAGRAEVLGLDTRSQAGQIRQRCGALLEHNGLYERMSAEDNLEFYGRVYHIPAAERRARLQEVLTHMGLWERRKEIVRDWSRGMKQKLAVARTLLHRPELVFLDEPTAGLDPVAALALREDLAALASKEGVTIFLTTHNLSEAEKLCDQVGVIRQGKLLAVGSPEQLRTHNGDNRVEIQGSGFNQALQDALRLRPEVVGVSLQDQKLSIELIPGAETAPLVTLIVSQGGMVEQVKKEAASLEDIFMTLMQEEGEAVSQ